MHPKDSFMNTQLSNSLREHLKPQSMLDATHCKVEFLHANYDRADLPKIVHEEYKYLNLYHRSKAIKLSTSFEELFDGMLRNWQTEPILQLKPGRNNQNFLTYRFFTEARGPIKYYIYSI